MSAALHPATVFFLYLLPVAVLLRLGRKCADSVSGKAFFFFFWNTRLFFWLTWASGDCRRRGATAISTLHEAGRPASHPLVWQKRLDAFQRGDAHIRRGHPTGFWLNVRAPYAQITGSEGTFPKQSACCVRRSATWVTHRRKGCNTRRMTSLFFFIWQTISSCQGVLVWCQWVHKKKKILEGSSWFLVNDLVWLERNKRPIKSRVMI